MSRGWSAAEAATFRTKVHRLMLAKGWSQADLARNANFNRQRVSAYLNRGHRPDDAALAALAAALCADPADLAPPPASEFLTGPVSIQSDGVRARVKLDLVVSHDDAMAIAEIARKYR